jgi:hypothetical protein
LNGYDLHLVPAVAGYGHNKSNTKNYPCRGITTQW